MYKRILLMIVSSMLVLLIAGCAPSNQYDQNLYDYSTGTEGVEINFIDFPNKLYEGDSLDAIIEIHNKGSYPSTGSVEGRLFASGFDRMAINGRFEDDRFPTTLVGKTIAYPQGGSDIMVFQDSEVRVPFEGHSYTAPIMISSCYKYRTEATPNVCIDPNPHSLDQEKACEEHDVSLSGGQGAPVAVTKVSQDSSRDYIYFQIHIRNMGGGKVIDKGSYYACPFNLEYSDYDKVLMHVETDYDRGPVCTPQGTSSDPVRLSSSGEGVMFCTFRNPGTEEFTTPLRITLEYAYTDMIKEELEIISVD